MADIIRLVQNGSTLINLVDWTGSAGNYKATWPMISQPEPDLLWHMPDYGQNKVVRKKDVERQAVIPLLIRSATSWDDLENALVKLKRVIYEVAPRYEIDGDDYQVYLEVKKDGATNGVYFPVIIGWLDDSTAPFTKQAESEIVMVTMTLIIGPAAQRTTTISLKNMLYTSPHFMEDSNDDGLADGWTERNTPTTIISTQSWLVGGKSQLVNADAANEGIYSDTVANTADTDAAGYAWVRVTTGTARVVLYDVTGAANLDAADLNSTDSNNVSDKSIVSKTGHTFYRVPMSATGFTAGNDVRLEIYSIGDAAVFYVDACYLELGRTTIPDAWMSSYLIENRDDIAGTSATTERHLNYVDVWGIPGDMDAAVQLIVDPTVVTTSPDKAHVHKWDDGYFTANTMQYWWEAEDTVESGSNVVSSDSADATRSGGTYVSLNPSADAGYWTFTAQDTATDVREFNIYPRRLYALVYVDNTAVTFTCTDNDEVRTCTATATWEVLDFGVINREGIYPFDPYDATKPGTAQNLFTMRVDFPSAAYNARVDAFYVPCQVEQIIGSLGPAVSNPVLIDGFVQKVEYTSGAYYSPHIGGLWTAKPGDVMSRYTFMIADSATQAHDLADAAQVTFVIRPQSRHLIGTK